MVFPNDSGDLSSEMEVDAFRRLFPLQFHELHLGESIRPDDRHLGIARDRRIGRGAVASANGSALVKTGSTTTLAAVKMEVMTPLLESSDEGCIAIDFRMPPICSPIVRPGRQAAPVVSKQLSDTIARQDVYCLNADGALFDTALLSAVAALSHLQIPAVSLNEDGKVVLMPEEDGEMQAQLPVNKEKRKLSLKCIPFSSTTYHKKHILADPTAEEESVMENLVTIVLDSSNQLISLNKPGGSVLAYTSSIQDCVALARQRLKELQGILDEANSAMDVY